MSKLEQSIRLVEQGTQWFKRATEARWGSEEWQVAVLAHGMCVAAHNQLLASLDGRD